MMKRILTIGLLAMVLGTFPAVGNVRANNTAMTTATATTAFTEAGLTMEATTSRRFGPYATLRRANEVANYARRHGYKAQVIYAGCLYCGTREYYVDVWL